MGKDNEKVWKLKGMQSMESKVGTSRERSFVPVTSFTLLPKARLLSVVTMAILNWVIICHGAALCILRCLATSLASVYWMPVAPPTPAVTPQDTPDLTKRLLAITVSDLA